MGTLFVPPAGAAEAPTPVERRSDAAAAFVVPGLGPDSCERLETSVAGKLGVAVSVRGNALGQLDLADLPERTFVVPTSFDFGLVEKARLAEDVSKWRRGSVASAIHYDEPRFDHPLLLDAFTGVAYEALERLQTRPEVLGLLWVANGAGDSTSRAKSYQFMRLLWERLGAAIGEAAFLRYDRPCFAQRVTELAVERDWLIVPELAAPGEALDHIQLILKDRHRRDPLNEWRYEVAQPIGGRPEYLAWIEQRIVELWNQNRQRQARTPSAKRSPRRPARQWGRPDQVGSIAEVRSAKELRGSLPEAVVAAERVLVKATWHGYAPGTYTDASTLDAFLTAISGRAVVIEGHTSSRNLGGAEFDWETEAKEHRRWIREQDQEFLRRTGIVDVLRKHKAQYVNATEEFWDGRCQRVGDVELLHPELATFIPSVLADRAGSPFVSLARFKGPTRLGISNMFGLIPEPLRARRHGPDIRYFANVCCDLALLYGSLFPMFGVVEAMHSAVRWDREGLYRSRWGNYDLIPSDGLVTVSEGLAGADVLAARLQGQDVRRSAFYEVVDQRLGLDPKSESLQLPVDLQAAFA